MRQKLTFLLVTVALLAGNFSGAQTVLTVEDEKVSVQDFKAIYCKNNRETVTTKADLDEYIELFVNFKLKVRAAKDLGMDTVKSFQKELAGYRKQLARPYLIDSDLLDELIEEAYDRKKEEVRASHILIKTPPNANAQDKAKAKAKIEAIKKRVEAGEDFNEIAKQESEDPSATTNSGDLGWFSVFNMVYPFEEAAYNTPIGQLSDVVETRFGYHILKVTDKRDAQGEVLVAHIMVKSRPESSEQSRSEAESKIKEIYGLLQNGADFEETALKYSEDKSTSRKGGQLSWFGAGKMVEEFEEVAFTTAVGEYSEPFMTSYGWHIVRKIDEKPVPEFDAIRSELKSKISRDTRSESTKASFLNKLKKEYNYEREDKCYNMVKMAADSGIYEGYIAIKKPKHGKKDLFSFADESYTVQNFLDYIGNSRSKTKTEMPSELVEKRYNQFVSDKILAYEDSQLESKHNDFRLLMNEYRDGILLFELTDEKVWSKAVKDSAGLVAFYEQNSSNFMWPERVQANIYEVEGDQAEKELRKVLSQPKMTAEDVKAALNDKSALTVQTRSGLFAKEDEPALEQIAWEKGVSETINLDGKRVIVDVRAIIPPSEKTLDDARGIITAEYQNYLEKQWIEELRKRYSYEVNYDALYSLISE